MTTQMSKELVSLTDLVLRKETSKYQDLLARERRLRHDLARLEEHRRSNINLAPSDLQSHRSIGGDLLWQSWVDRQKAAIQTELAQVLSQKEEKVRYLRRAFGRHEAAEHLFANDQRKFHRFLRSRREAELIELVTLHGIGKPE